MSIESIYRHISGLAMNAIFTTRELLIYDKRSVVDTLLSKLVGDQVIFRLARGVFIRDISVLPTALEILEAKAKAWGRRIVRHPEHLQHDFHIKRGPTNPNMFARIGGTTSFNSVRGRIYMKGISTKKMLLTETPVGQMIYALWYLGISMCGYEHVALVTNKFVYEDREEMRLSGALVPAWLNKLFIPYFAHRQPVVRPERPPVLTSWLF